MNSFSIVYSNNDTIHWEAIYPLQINSFPWYHSGNKQLTEVKLAIQKDVLHIKVHALDKHSSAKILYNNGPVYNDSCFEFFLTPEDKLGDKYLNFEINCVGSIYMAYNYLGKATEATEAQINQVIIKTSLPKKQIKLPTETDTFWTLDIQIPLRLIRELYGEEISLKAWHVNFYRCGGIIDNQYGMWKEMSFEKPNFHLPRQFKKLPIDKEIKLAYY